MENSKKLKDLLTEAFNSTEADNICLGMEIAELKRAYYYGSLLEFLKGGESGGMYFENMKPLYDKYGYEKVNRIILSLEEKGEQRDE